MWISEDEARKGIVAIASEQSQSRFYLRLDKAVGIRIPASALAIKAGLRSRKARTNPLPLNPSETKPNPKSGAPESSETDADGGEMIDIRDLFLRLCRGLPQILGLGLIGAAIAAAAALLLGPVLPVSTSARVMFSFSGYERGLYPDKSKFQPDDIRAPDVVADALSRQQLSGNEDLQGKIRGAVTIEASFRQTSSRSATACAQ